MKKLNLFVLFILFVCLLSGSALAVVVHDGWHEYTNVFTVDGKVVDIRLGENEGSLLRVKIDNISGLIEYKKCREYGIYTVCYANNSMDVDQVTISNTGKTMPGVHLIISKEDDILTDFTASPNLVKFYTFEEYKVNITIKNAKPEWVELFKYELTLPSDVLLVNPGDFVMLGSGKLSYTGTMNPNSQKVVSFTIMSPIKGSKKVDYILSMNSGGLAKETKSSFSFDVGDPFEPTITLTPDSLNVFDDSRLMLNIKNVGNLDLELTNLTVLGTNSGELNYFAGRGLSIVKPGVCSLNQKEILNPGIDVEYYMVLTPYALGRYNLSVLAYMKYNGKNIIYSNNKTLTSSADGFTPVLALSKTAVLSGSDVEVYYELVNTNPNTIFNNISVDINGNFVSEHLALDRLNAPDSKILLRKFITAPYVDKDEMYRITAETNYFTQSGEKKQIITSKDLKVTSNGSLISIRQSVNPVAVYPGQEVIVEVVVSNLKDEVFDVSARETVPIGIEKMGGIVLRNFTLKGLGSDSAYIYKLFVPLDTNLTGFNVTAIGRVNSKGYEASTSSHIEIRKNLSAPTQGGSGTANTGAGTGGSAGTGSSGTDTGTATGAGTGITGTGAEGIDVNNSASSTVINDAKEESGFRKFFRSVEQFFVNLFS